MCLIKILLFGDLYCNVLIERTFKFFACNLELKCLDASVFFDFAVVFMSIHLEYLRILGV